MFHGYLNLVLYEDLWDFDLDYHSKGCIINGVSVISTYLVYSFQVLDENLTNISFCYGLSILLSINQSTND